jgi:hypothetical protein
VLAVVAALCPFHDINLVDLYREGVYEHPRGGFSDGVMMYGRHPEFDVADPDNKLGRHE